MDELRFVRRDDRSLIVANDADEEFRLIVDDAVLSELRHLSRRERDTSRVRPREIQALIRAGKTRAQVARETGLDEVDIERYEEPVLAERRYILERAHAVAVRTDANDDADQRFGAVIAERLIALGTDTSEWESWRDEETGWMISLEFISRDVAHRAVWSFEHRKGTLSPVNPDAVNLSKQGDVGDRLIPKLRAVDNAEQAGRFDSDAFDTSQLPIEIETETPAETPDEASPALSDTNAEYERRREIDQRAIKTSDQQADLSQTADLLDALRKRRGERDRDRSASESHPARGGADAPGKPATDDSAPARARSIWQASGVTGRDDASTPSKPTAVPDPPVDPRPVDPRPTDSQPVDSQPADSQPADSQPAGLQPATPSAAGAQSAGPRSAPSPDSGTKSTAPQSQERPNRKGRASIPSWDDILFGTRSDEDPA